MAKWGQWLSGKSRLIGGRIKSGVKRFNRRRAIRGYLLSTYHEVELARSFLFEKGKEFHSECRHPPLRLNEIKVHASRLNPSNGWQGTLLREGGSHFSLAPRIKNNRDLSVFILWARQQTPEKIVRLRNLCDDIINALNTIYRYRRMQVKYWGTKEVPGSAPLFGREGQAPQEIKRSIKGNQRIRQALEKVLKQKRANTIGET